MTLRQQDAHVGLHVVVRVVPEHRRIPSPMYAEHCVDCRIKLAVSHVSPSVANFVTSQIGCSARDTDPRSLSIVAPVRRPCVRVEYRGVSSHAMPSAGGRVSCFQIHGTAQEMNTRQSRTAQIRTDSLPPHRARNEDAS